MFVSVDISSRLRQPVEVVTVGGRALAQQRHEVIVAEVRRRGSVRVTELADLLKVSDMTVRRDLELLDESGLLTKVHGGATALPNSFEPGFVVKSAHHPDEKAAIARAAAQLISPGSAIGLTAGTTTYALAAQLEPIDELTIVTNSIRVAELLTQTPRSDRTVVLTGGVRTPSDALVGPIAVRALRSLHLDLVFMGVHGITARAGFTTPNLLEAETNQAFRSAADRLVVLADHSKWGVKGLSTIADLGDADVVVIDDALDSEARLQLREHVGHLVLAHQPNGGVHHDADHPDPTPRRA